MNHLLNKKTIILIIFFLSFITAPYSFAEKTFVSDGMIFMNGEHLPQKKVNVKKMSDRVVITNTGRGGALLSEEEQILLQNQALPNTEATAVGVVEFNSFSEGAVDPALTELENTFLEYIGEGNETLTDEELPFIQVGLQKNTKKENKNSEEEIQDPKNIIEMIVGAIRAIWNKITLFEQNFKNIFTRLTDIENTINGVQITEPVIEEVTETPVEDNITPVADLIEEETPLEEIEEAVEEVDETPADPVLEEPIEEPEEEAVEEVDETPTDPAAEEPVGEETLIEETGEPAEEVVEVIDETPADPVVEDSAEESETPTVVEEEAVEEVI